MLKQIVLSYIKKIVSEKCPHFHSDGKENFAHYTAFHGKSNLKKSQHIGTLQNTFRLLWSNAPYEMYAHMNRERI